MHVALPTPAAGAEDELLSVLGEIRYNLRLKQFQFVFLFRLRLKIDFQCLRTACFSKNSQVSLLRWRLGCGQFPDKCTAWHLDNELLATAPGLALAFAGPTVLGMEVRGVVLRDEVIDVVVRLQDHVATLAAVAAARSALRLERFMRKCDATVAALAGSGLNLDCVDEHRVTNPDCGVA